MSIAAECDACHADRLRAVHYVSVVSKSKCPHLLASDVSAFGFPSPAHTTFTAPSAALWESGNPAAGSALVAPGDPRASALVKTAHEHATDPQMQQSLAQLQKTLEDQAKKAASPQNP